MHLVDFFLAIAYHNRPLPPLSAEETFANHTHKTCTFSEWPPT